MRAPRSSPGRARPPPPPASTARRSRERARRHASSRTASATCCARLPGGARARRRAGARVREHARRQRRARALARLPRLRQRAAAHVRAEPERADRGHERALRADPQPRRARSSPGCAAALVAHAEAHERCGVAGPRLLESDGETAALAPPLPDGRRHARAAHAAARARARRRGRAARALPRRPAGGAGRVRLDARRVPAPAPLDARRDRRLRRGLPDVRRGHRAAVPREPRGLGALVRARPRVATHDYQRVVDRTFLSRRTWWHLRGMARYVRRHPETLLKR